MTLKTFVVKSLSEIDGTNLDGGEMNEQAQEMLDYFINDVPMNTRTGELRISLNDLRAAIEKIVAAQITGELS